MAAGGLVARMSSAVQRSNLRALAFAYLVLLAVVSGLITGIALFGRSSDGKPMFQAAIPAITLSDVAPTKRLLRTAKPVGQAAVGTSATPTRGQSPASAADATPPDLPARIAKAIYAGSALIADPALIEETAAGPVPRIGDDGRTPMVAYAPPAAATKVPRIAIVVGGLGMSAKATALAISELPSGVTLAFPPYDSDVQHWVSEARMRGHEVLLEVPMEPFDFPNSDLGPHTLRADGSEDANIERLIWSLTRFSGYAGITNLLGGRLLTNRESLGPVMTFLTRRGLFFFDSSSSSRSIAPAVASQAKTAFVRSAMTIDTVPAAPEIDQKLSDLETGARETGAAAGYGFLYPVTVARIKVWAQGLAGRGFVLSPASAIVQPAR